MAEAGGRGFRASNIGLTRPAPGSSSGNGGGGFKWLRHAADPKRKDFARTVATSYDNRSEGRLEASGSLSRGLWDASWTVLAALLQVCGASWGVLGASSEAARRYIPILNVFDTFL